MNSTSVLLLLAFVSTSTSCRCPGSPGDLIAFTRLSGFYHHYAINVGNGYIVHLTGSSKNELHMCFKALFLRSGRCEIAEVKKEKCAVVKPGSKHIENKSWKGKKPLPANEIVKRALSKVGTSRYNLLYKNCEHFARWCRYGEEDSKQAENVMLGLYMLRVTFFASFLLLFLVSLRILYVHISIHFQVQLTIVAWFFPPGTIFGDILIIHEKKEKQFLIEHDLLCTIGK